MWSMKFMLCSNNMLMEESVDDFEEKLIMNVIVEFDG